MNFWKIFYGNADSENDEIASKKSENSSEKSENASKKCENASEKGENSSEYDEITSEKGEIASENVENADSENDDFRLFFSAERFDYTKGIRSKLTAFGTYLRNHPERRGKDVLFQLAVINRREVASYRSYQAVILFHNYIIFECFLRQFNNGNFLTHFKKFLHSESSFWLLINRKSILDYQKPVFVLLELKKKTTFDTKKNLMQKKIVVQTNVTL